jgi:archaemetzincin
LRVDLNLKLFALLCLLAAPASAEILYLQPLGADLPDADVEAVQRGIVEFYGLEVRILSRVPLPQAAWYAPRQRWRAEKILEFLNTQIPDDGYRILGLTAADISTTKGSVQDWGVLGLGELPGKSGVISAFRARKKAKDPLLPRERLAKVAVHEIGHTLGLDHCPSDGCLMHDAEGKVQSCDVEFDLCDKCRARIAETGRVIPPHPKAPWRPKGK